VTGNMQVDPYTEWTWKPAPQSWHRRAKVIVGALVIMAAGCITAGFIVGRMTAGPPGGNAAPHVGRVGEIPTAALAATSSVPFKKQPERAAAVASGGAAPSVVILNPGTADVGKQKEPDSAPSARDASQLLSDVRNPDPRDKRLPAVPDRFGGASDRREAGASTERDYQALRNYMLSR
jgi:hypothetical protein